MSIDNFTVEICDAPINIHIGEDILSYNIGGDNLNLNISDEIIKLYNIEEIFNSSLDGFLGSNDAAILGSYFIINEIPNGVKDNVNKIYTLAHTPLLDKAVVYLNGLLQAPGFDYMIVGNVITFIKALRPVYDLYVSYIRSN